jgi:alkylated DNA repair dioxygenase AlkB
VLNIVPAILEAVESSFPDNKYKELSNGVDILYSNEFVRGGSMGAHSDDEMHWGLVVIFSLGQTRWLRVRKKSNGAFFNVEMRHNSLIAMHGCSFQQLYTHQVDKLYKEEEVQCRLSLNLRFKEVDSVLPEVVVVPSIDSNITTQKKRKRPSSKVTVQAD